MNDYFAGNLSRNLVYAGELLSVIASFSSNSNLGTIRLRVCLRNRLSLSRT